MIWLAVPAVAAALYYLLAILAALKWWSEARRKKQEDTQAGMPVPLSQEDTQARMPVAPCNGVPLSILKPVHGRDPQFYEAIRSHATQDYPEFEILFGVSDPYDAALEDIERLQREFPERAISVRIVHSKAPNAKVGVLAELAAQARYPLLLVNDSDIVVEPGYLRAVTAPLEDPQIGLVTCLYRGRAESWAARAEAMGIATEFAPSVLVARLLGVSEFALGSTMVFRAEALGRFGGFDAISGYLADDYQLGRHICELGYRIVFAPVVVETDLGGETWAQTWRHQLRWSRTIRVSRPGGYFGYVVTHATWWALVAFAGHQWWAGGAALGVRMIAGVMVGSGVLKDRQVAPHFWMIPLRDLFGFAVWLAGAFGHDVDWRDRRLRLQADGRICGETYHRPG
ncbi:Glycosyl transferase, family 2 [Candidatus Sulfopaludibacter sp. SbA4]|nr:Glycosyl transferase, family 2 [Candidatus Sulfopaludibacter sp. SbA4]